MATRESAGPLRILPDVLLFHKLIGSSGAATVVAPVQRAKYSFLLILPTKRPRIPGTMHRSMRKEILINEAAASQVRH